MIPAGKDGLHAAVAEYIAARDPECRQESLARVEAFFDQESRVDLPSAPPWAQPLAHSVAALWAKDGNLIDSGTSWVISTRTLGQAEQLCPGGSVFEDQLVPVERTRLGTAFVVELSGGELAFLTARHVVSGLDLSRRVCVFGFHGPNAPRSLPEAQVVPLLEIIDVGSGADDWALVRAAVAIDRAVHPPLPIRRDAPAVGLAVAVLGFPFGLPLKFAADAHVFSLDFGLQSDLDTAQGNSGSPVLALRDGRPEVAGIVRASPRDLVPSPVCFREVPCKLSLGECAQGTLAVPIASVPGLA